MSTSNNVPYDLVKSGQSVNGTDYNGNTPFHTAARKNNFEHLRFLLSQDKTIIDVQNSTGESALFQAVMWNKYECAKFLIESAANVNLSNGKNVTPLHMAVEKPKIMQLLISNGANINAQDNTKCAPLHYAVARGCEESVCILLYHNADANVLDKYSTTPFMQAVIDKRFKMQEILFEYVPEFDIKINRTPCQCSILELALIYESPYLKNIMETNENITISTSALYSVPIPQPDVFKLVWDRLEYDPLKPCDIHSLINFDNMDTTTIETYVNIIMQSPNTDVLLNIFFEGTYSLFLNTYSSMNCDLDLLTKFTCILLEYSYKLTTLDIFNIFNEYGYCELFEILLYMDYRGVWLFVMLPVKLFFDMTDEIKDPHRILSEELRDVHPVFKKEILQFLRYRHHEKLIHRYHKRFPEENLLDRLPKVPSLVQLARDTFRPYLIEHYSISKSCQYHTIINSLNIPPLIKKILKFEIELYHI